MRYILQTVELAGLLSLAIVAPNVIGAMAKLGLIPSLRQREMVNRARNRLMERGFLELDGSKVRLTKKGELELRLLQAKERVPSQRQKWDGRWRVLIFDIPEYRRSARTMIRSTLTMIGFMRLQDSVWIYPYDCEDLILLLKADMKMGKDARYMIVEQLEYDQSIRKHFGLPLRGN